MINKVDITKTALKDLKRVPNHISDKLMKWVELVESDGLEEARKIKSYHDEPLKGIKMKQRSIRLSKAYRAYYEIKKNKVKFCEIQEVNKHEYKK